MLRLPHLRRHRAKTQLFSWLFVAFFEDGTIIRQTEAVEQGHSMMIDVTAKQKESPLVAFELWHIDGDKKVTVDLKTGAFIVNGIPLQAQSDFAFENPKPFDPSKHELKLEYWRTRREQLTQTATMQEDGSVITESVQLPSQIDRYFVGWSTTIDGERKQAILAVG